MSDIWTLALDGPGDPRPFLLRPRHQLLGQISRDGRWLAYTSDETGSTEVYVTTYPTQGAIKKLSQARGAAPLWSPSGDDLFFVQGQRLVAMRFNASGPVSGSPVPVGPDSFPVGTSVHDVLPDGRFVITTEEPEPANARTPVVVLNWPAQFRTTGAPRK